MGQSTDTEKPKVYTPLTIALFSLAGYPGAGHLILGKKRLGGFLILLFTLLTFGVLYEVVTMALPVLKLYELGEPLTLKVNWARLLFWIMASGLVWLGSGIHSYFLAKNAPKTQ